MYAVKSKRVRIDKYAQPVTELVGFQKFMKTPAEIEAARAQSEAAKAQPKKIYRRTQRLARRIISQLTRQEARNLEA